VIELALGGKQRFRYRHGDINLIGNTDRGSPVVVSDYSLNNSPPVHFYVEPEPRPGQRSGLGTRTPGVIRLSDRPGWFNIEIPVHSPYLREGLNDIEIRVQRAGRRLEILNAQFNWDSRPVLLPLQLDDLSACSSIQEVGQVVDGVFEIDRDRNVIRTVEPIGADVLLLLGSPFGSQEATYDVRFGALEGMFFGLSDFFVGHEPLAPELGIKPGYSTAGLATVSPGRWAEAWLARGALLDEVDPRWTLCSPRPVRVPVRAATVYRVRHQVLFAEGVNLVRFRIWPKGEPEPARWMCEEHDADLAPHLPRHTTGSFGLFQYGGRPTEWSNIELRALEVTASDRASLRKKKRAMRPRLRAARRRAGVERKVIVLARKLKRLGASVHKGAAALSGGALLGGVLEIGSALAGAY